MTEALKACPNPWCSATRLPRCSGYMDYWTVDCACGVSTFRCSTREAAITAWNTRTAAAVDAEEAKETPQPVLGIVAQALYDVENTARLSEHPEQVPAYQHKAAELIRWIGILGGQVTARDAEASLPDGWRTMESAPHDGTEIEAWTVHFNARFSKDPVGEGWACISRIHWIDFNGGGWTWEGLCGEHVYWRPVPVGAQAGGEDPVGCAERQVGRYIYKIISARMGAKPGTPEAAELEYLATIVSDVEEYGADEMSEQDIATPRALAPEPTGGVVEERVGRAVEPIILRRLRDNRIDGYTLEMSREICRAALAAMRAQAGGGVVERMAKAIAFRRMHDGCLGALISEFPSEAALASFEKVWSGAAASDEKQRQLFYADARAALAAIGVQGKQQDKGIVGFLPDRVEVDNPASETSGKEPR